MHTHTMDNDKDILQQISKLKIVPSSIGIGDGCFIQWTCFIQ